MSLDELNIISEKIENVTIYKITGNINSFTSQKFLESMQKGIKKGAMILDLEDVNMITSQGVTSFRELADLSFTHRVRVVLINLSHSAKQVFQMAGIRNLFMVPDNEETAMKLASRPYR
jgi:anti-anti-sigma factor